MVDWHLDDSYHIDWKYGREIVAEIDFFDPAVPHLAETYIHRVTCKLEGKVEFELDVIHGVAIDLLQLVPQKFRKYQILIDYMAEAGLQVGSWLTKVQDIVKLESPYTVSSMDYLRHLGTIIGVSFPPEDETSELEMRKTLAQAIDWYKLKGTYQSVQIIAMIHQFTVNLYDMYTKDYFSFYMVDWFVGDENENPPGYDATYYKSPHFGLEILLNKVYEDGSLYYLWKSEYLDNFRERVEETRPVHTIPHYLIFLNPKTDEFGHTIKVDGDIRTKVLGDWEISTRYFDMIGSLENWNFDETGIYFDQSQEAFLKSITKWVLGTGNYPYSVSGGFDTVENPVLSGTINPANIVIADDRITFEFIVPKAIEQDDISELGLYIPGSPDKLVVLSCFPKIDKEDDVEFRVVVEVYRSDLS